MATEDPGLTSDWQQVLNGNVMPDPAATLFNAGLELEQPKHGEDCLQECNCRSCRSFRVKLLKLAGASFQQVMAAKGGMPLCKKCGNKRCPHITNHVFRCTGSNVPDQPGSLY